jgi:hypothetical protein
MGGGIIQRLRAAGLVLALAAITFKAFLPPGFMLGDEAGRLTIVLCSIDGATELTYDPVTGTYGDPHTPSAPHSDSAGQHCPFAVAGAAALTPVAEDIAPPRFAFAIDSAATPLAERPHATPTGPPLPARGPPLQA